MRMRRRFVVGALLAVAAIAVATVVVVLNRDTGPAPLPQPTTCDGQHGVTGRASDRPFVGTLNTHAGSAAAESRAGVKMAMLELSWREAEPQDGGFDAAYFAGVCGKLRAYQAAGMQVTLGLGLHYTPQWVLDRPGSRYVDQHGAHSSQVDLVFSAAIRTLAGRYLRRVDELVGLEHFWAVRVTAGGNGELTYPAGGYWAFSSGAQGGADRPDTLAPNPSPGWRPGDLSLSVGDRGRWARWYVGALADVADWQARTLRGLGFRGYLQVLTPGQGLRPMQLARQAREGLPDGLLARGAVWSWVYEDLEVRDAVTAYVSSVADGSGADDSCGDGDEQVALDSRQVFDWSAARWVTRVARENGFTIAGETPSLRDVAKNSDERRTYYADPSGDGLAARAYAQASGCGFLGLYWAHDDQVSDGTVRLSALGELAGPAAAPPAPAAG